MMVGDNIKSIRTSKRITQDELAKSLGIAASTVSAWEINRNEPSLNMLEQIASILECNVSDLIGGSTVTMDASTFSAFTNKVNTSALSEDEQLILDTYRSLSQIGKMKLYAYMESLK